MDIPKVDTFEHDIANEIRQKEASLEDIVSAGGNVGNDTTDEAVKKNQSVLISIITILTLCGLTGALYVGYLYYSDKTSTVTLESTTAEQKKKNSASIATISPVLDQSIGRFFGLAEKTNAGYVVEIKDYSSVFAYMIRNESEFANELGEAIGNKRKTVTTSTSTPSVQPIITQATTSTSTLAVGTSTQGTTTLKEVVHEESAIPENYIFSDITISNQNMRVATSIHGTVAYAFVGTKNLVISSSTNGILALRSRILQK